VSSATAIAPAAVTAAPPQAIDLAGDSVARTVALHLLPGLAGLAVFLLTAPILAAAGWPALFAFYGPMTAAILAVEGAWLLRERRRRAIAGDPTPLVNIRGRLGWPRLAAWAAGLFLVGVVLTGALAIADRALVGSVFAGLPSWWLVTDPTSATGAARGPLLATVAVGLVMNGFLGPIVEESYFRGYLLPRLSRFGRWAPVINAALFSMYHFWQPWALVSRFGYVLPYAAAVRRTGSVGLGMVVHSAANLVGLLVLLSLVVR
jgi:membrane protease YdiL (CAAX protease family)